MEAFLLGEPQSMESENAALILVCLADRSSSELSLILRTNT